MEFCSFQVIYLLCLTSGGAGRDVDGEGAVREIGRGRVTQAEGTGEGCGASLSRFPIPSMSEMGRRCPNNQRSSTSGAHH